MASASSSASSASLRVCLLTIWPIRFTDDGKITTRWGMPSPQEKSFESLTQLNPTLGMGDMPSAWTMALANLDPLRSSGRLFFASRAGTRHMS